MATIVESVFKGDTAELQRRVPVAARLTPEFFARERDKIFRRAWLPLVRAHEVPERGSYLVRDFPTLRTSLLIVRGQDDRIRVFHNVCTHRGNKLVRSGEGCAKRLVCGFHGWAFSTEGTLETVTDEHQFRDLDKSILGLRPVHAETWEDFVFVNFDATPRETLADWLGELYGGYGGYFQRHYRLAGYKVRVKSNWNLGVNSFTEGYHTMYIHRNSVPDYQGGRKNPQRHRPFLELMKRHHRYSAPANPDHRLAPAEAVAWRYGKKTIPAFTDDMTGMPPGVNPSRHDNWAFDVVQFFPNMVVLFGNTWHMEMQFWPIDHDYTDISLDAYVYKPKDLGERISQEFYISRGRQIMLEDLNTLEAQHEMLSSGALSHVQLSQQEISLQHHYKTADEMMAEA